MKRESEALRLCDKILCMYTISRNHGTLTSALSLCLICGKPVILPYGLEVKEGDVAIGLLHDVCKEPWEASQHEAKP
jgi:hypothetical protein